MNNPLILHFQEEYTDIDKLLSSFDLREYVIPYSSYLTNIINNYLMENNQDVIPHAWPPPFHVVKTFAALLR